jgi:hypothetical protein
MEQAASESELAALRAADWEDQRTVDGYTAATVILAFIASNLSPSR